MKIKRKKDKIIVELDMWQDSYDAIGQLIGQVPNLIGVIAGDEQGIAQVNDLGYKGDQQVGGFIINTYFERDKFIKLCEELEIDCEIYPLCAYCNEPLLGCLTVGDKGYMCLDCEEKNNK